jgi:hypothetical protein
VNASFCHIAIFYLYLDFSQGLHLSSITGLTRPRPSQAPGLDGYLQALVIGVLRQVDSTACHVITMFQPPLVKDRLLTLPSYQITSVNVHPARKVQGASITKANVQVSYSRV